MGIAVRQIHDYRQCGHYCPNLIANFEAVVQLGSEALILGLARFSLPLQVADGAKRLLMDIFAMATSAVVVFLPADPVLQRDRDYHKLEPTESSDEYRYYETRFPDTRFQTPDVSLSIVVGTGLSKFNIVLLGDKLIGWFS